MRALSIRRPYALDIDSFIGMFFGVRLGCGYRRIMVGQCVLYKIHAENMRKTDKIHGENRDFEICKSDLNLRKNLAYMDS